MNLINTYLDQYNGGEVCDCSLLFSWAWIVFWFEEVTMGGRTSFFNWVPWTGGTETYTADS